MVAAPEEKSVESRSHMVHPASQGPTPQRLRPHTAPSARPNCPVAGATYALHRPNPRSLQIAGCRAACPLLCDISPTCAGGEADQHAAVRLTFWANERPAPH